MTPTVTAWLRPKGARSPDDPVSQYGVLAGLRVKLDSLNKDHLHS